MVLKVNGLTLFIHVEIRMLLTRLKEVDSQRWKYSLKYRKQQKVRTLLKMFVDNKK